ncbi:MAG: sodium:alanine symporter family protein, partial [Rhodospirillales bacterium]|nr:sodium:alanine symporter family protein [Rhodospirillales bacterium]
MAVFAGILAGISPVFAAEQGIDQSINAFVAPVANAVAGTIFYSVGGVPLIVVWLVVGAVFFTFYFNFINFRAFGHAIDLVRGKYEDPNDPGEVSHFQALATALSATVGLGNIAGVAVAVSLGGPGATFWMILAGLLGMSSKFCECTLGVMYRDEHADGTVSGGPMYYLSKGLAERGMPGLGRIMA